MAEVVIKGHRIEFYDSIKEMPIRRYQQSNKYLMIASDIGSDFEDYGKRSLRVLEFLRKGMIKEAIEEIENRRQTVWNAFKEFTPKGYALALLVKSINGKLMTDITDKGLDEVLDKLDSIGFTYNDMIENLSEVKKKSTSN